MIGRGFVYTGTLNSEQIQNLLKRLNNAVWLSWDLTSINFDKNLRDNGIAFNYCCEVRWQRIGEDAFQVWMLSDKEMEVKELPLTEVDGEWQMGEADTRLVPLDAPHFNPPFDRYPNVNSEKAKLKSHVFYRNGVAMFVSPREVIPE